MSQSSSPTPRLRHSIPESAELLSISQRQVWRKVAAGELKIVRDGRRVFIPRSELERAAGNAG